MKKALLLSVLAMSAGLASAQPVMMEIPQMDNAVVKADFAKMTVKSNKNLAVPVKKLGSYQLAKGKIVETYMMSDGMVAKRLVTDSNVLPRKAKVQGKVYTAVAAFQEGFEGYDGTTYDWIPANWQDVSKTTPAHVAPGKGTKKANLTWETVDGSFSQPNSGKYMARIQVSIADQAAGVVEEVQDEWLITPAFTVPAASYLNFYLSYSPAFTRLNMETFDFTGKNNILEVLVSADNGATWNKLWDVMEDAMKYTEDELWNDAGMMVRPYIPVLVNLKDYENKSVQVAFRYVGKSGESMCVDDVAVGTFSPIAKYEEPVNFMRVGLSNDWKGMQKGVGLYPAYQSLTWKNASQLANGYSWEYADPNSQFDWNTGTSSATMFADTKDLVAPAYPMGYFSVPVLTASLDANTAEFKSSVSMMQVGANMDETDQTGNIVRLWGAGLYDAAGLMKYMPTREAGLYATDVFGFGSTFDATWNQVVTANNLGNSASLVGAGVIVEKPVAPYMLSYIYAFVNKEAQANNFMDPASKLKVEVHALNDEGAILPEVLATGTCLASDISAEGTALFFLERQEGELIEAVDLTVTTGLYIEMSLVSANPAKDNVSLLTLLAPDGLGIKDYDALVHLNIDGQDKFMSAGALGFNGGLRARGYSFHLGVTYNWLFERNGKNTFDSISPDGGSCTFNMNSLYNMEAMATVDGEGMYDWWDVSYGQYDVQTGNQDMIFTFQPLPAGVDDRRCMARVSAPGVPEVQYYISQLRHGGVESVVASASSAQFVDGNFVVSSTVADAVSVYNVSGQLVASAALDGTAVIPAADLAKGMYVVRFNDNTVVKVMK